MVVHCRVLLLFSAHRSGERVRLWSGGDPSMALSRGERRCLLANQPRGTQVEEECELLKPGGASCPGAETQRLERLPVKDPLSLYYSLSTMSVRLPLICRFVPNLGSSSTARVLSGSLTSANCRLGAHASGDLGKRSLARQS